MNNAEVADFVSGFVTAVSFAGGVVRWSHRFENDNEWRYFAAACEANDVRLFEVVFGDGPTTGAAAYRTTIDEED